MFIPVERANKVAFSAPEAAHAAVLRCILFGYPSSVPSPLFVCPHSTLDRTPKLRHAEFHYLGTPACFLHFVVNKQPPSGGSMEILKGFPRPVGAVVSPHTWALS
jgi:hypothetical protein